MRIIKTPKGQYVQDPSGLWYYQPDTEILEVLRSEAEIPMFFSALRVAAEDALAYAFRLNGPAWFWFEGMYEEDTFAPIEPGDTVLSLTERYRQWDLSAGRLNTLNGLRKYVQSTEKVR